MKITSPSRAGSQESNDILIIMYPSDRREIQLESIVGEQFGDAIEKTINETLDELGIENVRVEAYDKGALDYCIRARVKACVKRGKGE